MKRAALMLSIAALSAVALVRSVGVAPAAGNPLGRAALPLARPLHIRATVREQRTAGSYVYLRLRDAAGGDRWLVTVRGARSVQGCVEATAYARAERFDSPRLGARFEPLLFGAARPCP